MNENAPNVNRRKFLRQSVAFMAVGAGTLVSPAGFLSITYMTKAALLEEPAVAHSPSGSPLSQGAIPLTRGLLYPQQNHIRNVLDTSGLWQFQLDPREEGEAQGWFNALPSPRSIAVPCSWNDLFDDARDYLGLAWYWNELWVPSGWRGQRVFLRVGSANYAAKVWVNGALVAEHFGGHLPFVADIGSHLAWDRKNVIAISVENEQLPERVPPGPASKGAGVFGTMAPFPATTYDFFPYAGLHRPVLLYSVLAAAHIDGVTVVTTIDGRDGVVTVKVAAAGECSGKGTVHLNDSDADLNFSAGSAEARVAEEGACG